jgi:hypothetical protein
LLGQDPATCFDYAGISFVAIALPSDIIMDVARAADPAAAEAARDALAAHRANAAAQATGSGFAAQVPMPRTASGQKAVPESFQRFEAMVLQSFIQTMLPKDSESVYGKGMAGDMWKSMMAEQLSVAMAGQGGIGIASHLLRDRYVDGGSTPPIGAVSDPQAQAPLDDQQALSFSLVEEMQRRLARSLAQNEGSAGNESIES